MEKIENEIKNDVKKQNGSAIKLLEENEKNPKQQEILKQENTNEENPEPNTQLVSQENLELKPQVIEDEETQKIHKKTEVVLIVIAILVVITALLSTIFAIINKNSKKIVNGIQIGITDVSNLTKEEAIEKIKNIYETKAENQIYFKHGEFETSITYEALEVNYQIENAVQKAYDIGRTSNIFKDNFDILKTWITGQKIELQVTIDNDMITQIAENINNSIEDAVVQSSYYVEKEQSKLIITSGKKGVVVDEKQLLEEIYNVLKLSESLEDEPRIEVKMINTEPEKINIEKIHEEIYKEVKDAYYTQNPFTIHPEEEGIDFDIEAAKAILLEQKEEYEIPLKITKPQKTVREIGTAAFPDLLGECKTKYNAGNTDRTTNMKLAANKINGVVLLPNQEFSYNKEVGERTVKAGYKMAATYSNGKVVDGIGGGICQISSTLYDAVVFANLKITTRRNHQFVTSYLPAGKDATVVWGSQDFKFVNTRKNPIRIVATVSGGIATVQIWGVKEEVEYDISIETKKVATIPFTTQYIQDPTLPAGTTKVVQAGNNGRKVEAYKVMKLNGKVVSTTLLSRDTYNAMKKIVHIGAK